MEYMLPFYNVPPHQVKTLQGKITESSNFSVITDEREGKLLFKIFNKKWNKICKTLSLFKCIITAKAWRLSSLIKTFLFDGIQTVKQKNQMKCYKILSWYCCLQANFFSFMINKMHKRWNPCDKASSSLVA